MRLYRLLRRPSALSVLFVGLWCCVACHKSQPDFGTLPRVVVPLGPSPQEQPPAPAPTSDAESAEPEVVTTDLPDPPPLYSRDWIEYTLLFDRGELSVVKLKRLHSAQDEPTVRRMGRFAFELWLGKQLVERVRFDFPLLATGRNDQNDAIENGLTAQTVVRVPATDRAAQARILDRKTRRLLEIPWPAPSAEAESPASDTKEVVDPPQGEQ